MSASIINEPQLSYAIGWLRYIYIYRPMLCMELYARTLSSEWSTCSLVSIGHYIENYENICRCTNFPTIFVQSPASWRAIRQGNIEQNSIPLSTVHVFNFGRRIKFTNMPLSKHEWRRCTTDIAARTMRQQGCAEGWFLAEYFAPGFSPTLSAQGYMGR